MTKRLALASKIRSKIILNDFRPGEGIPEESLAAEFAVSRTPIREALLRLESHGLLTSEPNRGFSVASVSIEQIRSYFDAARIVIPSIAKFVMARAEKSSIRRLRNGLLESSAPDAIVQYDFVEELGILSRNHFLSVTATSAEGYHCFVRTGVLDRLSEDVRRVANNELKSHRENILEAVLHDDPAEAERAALQMVEGARVFLIGNLV
jgi:DNA-binding GntR family transcriptional regulator